MSGFKLIAIKTGAKQANKANSTGYKSIEDDYLKVLQPETLYQFFSDYKFVKSDSADDDVSYKSISQQPQLPDNFYSAIRSRNSKDTLAVSISAIVGQNGSGKSSLLELLFATLYNFSVEFQILKNNNSGAAYKKLKNIDAEIYYELNDLIYVIKSVPTSNRGNTQSVKLYNFLLDDAISKEYLYNRELELDIEYQDVFIKTIAGNLYYTIAINYSHFSLNPNILGKWVNNIFHKNDGYQTPIVLNPFRDNGIINMNKEEYLTKSRLLSNILTRDPNTKKLVFSEIIMGKTASRVSFKLNKKKLKFSKDVNTLYSLNKEDVLNHIEWLFANFYDSKDIAAKMKTQLSKDYQKYENEIKYIIRKLYHIFTRYDTYNRIKYTPSRLFKVQSKDFNEKNFLDLINRNLFFKDLSSDFSHVTYKLRQVLNYLLHYDIYQSIITKPQILEDVSNKIFSLMRKYKYDEQNKIEYYLPPSYFDSDIEFGDRTFFSSLSSGEKQLVYGSTTYIYHILNLNSVNPYGDIIKYKYVNIVFDEIELCFHPELQKAFINHLLFNLSHLSIPDIEGINVLLVTHSPFILSDIPSNNILKLEKGIAQLIKENEQSFGANIFDLLQNEFFFKDGFIGNYAHLVINDVLEFIESKRKQSEIRYHGFFNKSQIKMIIDNIGEPFLKEEMMKQYFEIFPDEYDEQKEISQLEERIKEIKNAQINRK